MDALTFVFINWLVVTLLFIGLLCVRRRLVSREQDWIPLNAPVSAIADQQRIELGGAEPAVAPDQSHQQASEGSRARPEVEGQIA